MNFVILGTGFISDAYLRTLHLHPELTCVGVFDRDPQRALKFAKAFNLKAFPTFSELLACNEVDCVLNLTNPREHAATTRACLEAGKHVYSEKPLAMLPDEAGELVQLARRHQRLLSCAPCSSLSPSADTLDAAIRQQRIGKVRMVYANFDDGMIAPHESPWQWCNGLGFPWPAKDEFEVGCTYEHAGYFLTWLCRCFGPVQSMTAFASTQIPDKGIPVDSMAPDFTCGLLQFANGVVARVTCGLVAPKDKSLTVIGDTGTLEVLNLRDDHGTVWLKPYQLPLAKLKLRNAFQRLQKRLPRTLPRRWRQPLEFSSRLPLHPPQGLPALPEDADKRVDFLRGPQDLADAIRDQRQPMLSAELGCHIVEIIHQLQYPAHGPVLLRTSFASPNNPSAS